MRRMAVLSLCLLTSVAAAPVSALTMQELVGLWYGEGYQPLVGLDMQWIVERRADGTFEAEFRVVVDCQVELRQLEAGRWGLIDQGFFVIVDSIDGIEVVPVGPDRYTVQYIDENSIDYTHVGLNLPFKARRVQAGFSMPACVS